MQGFARVALLPSAERRNRQLGSENLETEAIESLQPAPEPIGRLPQSAQRWGSARRVGADRLAVPATAPALLHFLHPCGRFWSSQQRSARRQKLSHRLIGWLRDGVQNVSHRHCAPRQGNPSSLRHAVPVESLLNSMTTFPIEQALFNRMYCFPTKPIPRSKLASSSFGLPVDVFRGVRTPQASAQPAVGCSR